MVCHRFGEDVAYVPPAVREGGRGIFVHMTDITSSVQEVNRPRVKIFYNYCHLSKYPVIGYLRTIICVLLIKESDDTVKIFLRVRSL